jgi:hypothetical protein
MSQEERANVRGRGLREGRRRFTRRIAPLRKASGREEGKASSLTISLLSDLRTFRLCSMQADDAGLVAVDISEWTGGDEEVRRPLAGKRQDGRSDRKLTLPLRLPLLER